MKKFIAYALTVLSAFAVFGQNPSDSAKVFFRISQHHYDSSLGDNRASMDGFVNRIRKASEAGDIDHIVVRAYASPDGVSVANERLAGSRCQSIVDYIIANTGVSPELIQASPEGIAWVELRRLVAENPDVPSRDRVLDILDNTPVWVYDAQGNIIDSRKKQLMSLAGGEPYRWMYDHLFPRLRNAAALSLYLKSDLAAAEPQPAALDRSAAESADTLAVAVQPDSVLVQEPIIARDTVIVAQPESTPLNFALKTNLLYDAALMPNIEFEWLINRHWSVEVEADVAWWSRDSRHRYYQILAFQAEGRRWIKSRAPGHGIYVGLFAGGGKYDLEFGSNRKGYKGEGGLAGLSFGYMFPISRCLSFDAEIGAGYMRTRFNEYHPYDGHYLFERTKNLNYFGPLRARFAFVWRFNVKSKKVNPAL